MDENKKLQFTEVMKLIEHIGDQEKHFNNLETEYRKLASQWLLVALGAIGFVLTKENVLPLNPWILVMAISLAASIGILVLWLLDLKVYHKLLNCIFEEGALLEKQYPEMLPQIRNKMKDTQIGGDVVKRVILYYFFSIAVLIAIANLSIWFSPIGIPLVNISFNIASAILLALIYKLMTNEK